MAMNITAAPCPFSPEIDVSGAYNPSLGFLSEGSASLHYDLCVTDSYVGMETMSVETGATLHTWDSLKLRNEGAFSTALYLYVYMKHFIVLQWRVASYTSIGTFVGSHPIAAQLSSFLSQPFLFKSLFNQVWLNAATILLNSHQDKTLRVMLYKPDCI